MVNSILYLVLRLASFGVIHRDEAKNDIGVLRRLVRLGFVRKVHRGRKVFYEFTEKALPLLEEIRKVKIEEAKILATLHKTPSLYHNLISDVRFLDENHPAAKRFRLLGDWQLRRPVTPSQLALSKMRYYQDHLENLR